MSKNIPKYTTDAIDDIAVSAIECLMYKNIEDILEILDCESCQTFEERKRAIGDVLLLFEAIPSTSSLDLISRAYTLFNRKVIRNYLIIRDVLLPYISAFRDSPNIQMSPFHQLVAGQLIAPIQKEEIFKEYVVKLQQLMRSRYPIMLSELYEKNEVIKKYNLNKQDFSNLKPSQNRKSRSLSV